MFAKPEPHRKVKARTVREFARLRQACVDAVWKRADSCCERCGWHVMRPRETDQPLSVGHVHELIPRSRGGDPTDPAGAVLLCTHCHAKAHRLHVAD